MKREAGVLQQRVQASALCGNGKHTLKRIRQKDEQQEETDANQSLYGDHSCTQRGRQVIAEGCYTKAKRG